MSVKYNYFSGEFDSLYPDEIFVFGSNEAGIHGSGAARTAREKFGAVYGVGVGITGDCYAIPTKDKNIQTLPPDKIRMYVEDFKEYAWRTYALPRGGFDADKIFLVTKIGCGLAGYKNEDIAPMFRGSPKNCWFDLEWEQYLT